MSIEMPAAEVHRLADTLRAAGRAAEQIGTGPGAPPDLGEPSLQAAAEAFLESHQAAGRAFAGELRRLGDTVAAVADSWLRLDGTLLDPRTRVR